MITTRFSFLIRQAIIMPKRKTNAAKKRDKAKERNKTIAQGNYLYGLYITTTYLPVYHKTYIMLNDCLIINLLLLQARSNNSKMQMPLPNCRVMPPWSVEPVINDRKIGTKLTKITKTRIQLSVTLSLPVPERSATFAIRSRKLPCALNVDA